MILPYKVPEMTVNGKHIDRIFSQKFSLLDQKIAQTYFSEEELNKETKEVLEDQWDHFAVSDESSDKLDGVFYKLYYQIDHQQKNQSRKSPG